jgi:hypothetical protein
VTDDDCNEVYEVVPIERGHIGRLTVGGPSSETALR